MSKHIFTQYSNGIPYNIQIGWDRPLQRYYGTILTLAKLDDDNEGDCYAECPIWSDTDNGFDRMSLEEIAKNINDHGFTIPEGLLKNVERDCLTNAPNGYYFYELPPEDDDSPFFMLTL